MLTDAGSSTLLAPTGLSSMLTFATLHPADCPAYRPELITLLTSDDANCPQWEIDFWDTPGTEAMLASRKGAYNDADCVLVAYSMLDPDSLTNVVEWCAEVPLPASCLPPGYLPGYLPAYLLPICLPPGYLPAYLPGCCLSACVLPVCCLLPIFLLICCLSSWLSSCQSSCQSSCRCCARPMDSGGHTGLSGLPDCLSRCSFTSQCSAAL